MKGKTELKDILSKTLLLLLLSNLQFTSTTKLHSKINRVRPRRFAAAGSCCKETSTITVLGEAEENLSPTIVKIGLLIKTKSASASKSLEENYKKSAKVIDTLTKMNIQGDNVTTKNYDISPYNRDEIPTTVKKEKSNGFKAKQIFEITRTDLDDTADLLDKMVNLGCKVLYVRLMPDEKEIVKYRGVLIHKAVGDAMKKAKMVLRKFRYKIGGIKKIKVIEETTPVLIEKTGGKLRVNIKVTFMIKNI